MQKVNHRMQFEGLSMHHLDDVIFEMLISGFTSRYGKNIEDIRARGRVRLAALKAKNILSANPMTRVTVE